MYFIINIWGYENESDFFGENFGPENFLTNAIMGAVIGCYAIGKLGSVTREGRWVYIKSGVTF